MADVTNSAKFQLGASNSPTFQLFGGRYAVAVVGTFAGGSIDLQFLGPDDATWISCLSVPLTANDGAVVDLPPGTFRFVVTNATGCFASIYPVRS